MMAIRRRMYIFFGAILGVCLAVCLGLYTFYPERFRDGFDEVGSVIEKAQFELTKNIGKFSYYIENKIEYSSVFVLNGVEKSFDTIGTVALRLKSLRDDFVQQIDMSIEASYDLLKPIEVASNHLIANDSRDNYLDMVALNNIEPASGSDVVGSDVLVEDEGEFYIDETSLVAEAVLVPKDKTVISSSRDGKISKIYFDNGDTFKKGDILLEYNCFSIQAEVDAAVAQNRFAREKTVITDKLYDLELVSKIDRLESQLETKKATAGKVATESKYNDCIIRASYDGRVVKRLANANEYTRTDRVLMEVASTETLDAEFLLPSNSLRWVNVGAPISIDLHETGVRYVGKIKRIYGEVDPVSQSVQVRAEMKPYDHPLLPGMSGKMSIDLDDVKKAGIRGFLEIGHM